MLYFFPEVAVCYDDMTKEIAKELVIEKYDSLPTYSDTLKDSVIVSVHGREIVGPEWTEQYECFNIHPYLYCYKGADPIGKAMKAGNRHASVGLHRMTSEVDQGEVLLEVFTELKHLKGYDSIYDQLYPLYHACFVALKNYCVTI